MELVNPALANGVGVVGVVFMVGVLIMRGHLIPGRTHREVINNAAEAVSKAEERADRWEAVALRALSATEQMVEPMAVTAKVLTKLPSPTQDGVET